MASLKNVLIDFAIRRHRFVAIGILLFTLCTGSFFPWITMDTDPENMLEKTEPARVFHNWSKKEFDLNDTIVVGVIKEEDPDGVFNPETLGRVHELTEYARTLRWEDPKCPGKFSGVIEASMIAPAMVDHLSQQEPGILRFDWLMPRPPETREEARAIRDKALSNPILKGQMVSEDGKALCLYLPLTDKMLSYRVFGKLQEKIRELGGDETYHIAGLPVAESAIGVEMFKQMTFAAPLTMAAICGLLLLFFRKWVLVLLPMIVATVAVVGALGLMIAFGHPVHILSSMLPIFLMPIAICDTVHILSDFFESYTREKGRMQTIREVMQALFAPILFTSLTTAAGFLSFLTTAIPPARVFGVFVAAGVMIAWFATLLLVPAYVMMIPERTLTHFGKAALRKGRLTGLETLLQHTGRVTVNHARAVLCLIPLLILMAAWGISRININDNYAKRFSTDHSIRRADDAINRHFGGTYTAYLILEGADATPLSVEDIHELEEDLVRLVGETESSRGSAAVLLSDIRSRFSDFAKAPGTREAFMDRALHYAEEKTQEATDEEFQVLEEVRHFFGTERERLKTFKQPAVLEYLAGLQSHVEKAGLVGKSTSVADVVRKVNQELIDGKEENYRIPERFQEVSECYMQYQQSHRPKDLWHLVTPDFMRAALWMQFSTGDSTQTARAVKAVEDYMRLHKPPVALSCNWAGLHYVNLVFQDIMFWQMLASFGGTLIIVFIMMTFLFRSALWAAASMVPLILTIAAIYGLTGIVGKDYDMPVAVLSAITIGIGIDFAVHFMQRSRQIHGKTRSWRASVPMVFGEPAVAITRNVLVVALGFLPLMVAQLIPYRTTAILLFGILFSSGLITLLLLPAMLTVGEKWFFPRQREIPQTEESTTREAA